MAASERERQQRVVLELKGRNGTGGGRDQLGQCCEGSRNRRTDVTLGLSSVRVIGGLDKSSFNGTEVGEARPGGVKREQEASGMTKSSRGRW